MKKPNDITDLTSSVREWTPKKIEIESEKHSLQKLSKTVFEELDLEKYLGLDSSQVCELTLTLETEKLAKLELEIPKLSNDVFKELDLEKSLGLEGKKVRRLVLTLEPGEFAQLETEEIKIADV